MRFLGEILVNLQSHDVVFAFQIDDGSSQPTSSFVIRSANFPSGDLSLMMSFASSDGTRQLTIRMTATADIVFTAFVSGDTSASKDSFCFV